MLSRNCEGEAKVFFIKMVGDYHRYHCENAKGDEYEEVKQKALQAYTEAN